MTLFEKIIAGEIPATFIHQDDLCVAFQDIAPKAPTHLLIVPKKPIPRVGEADESDQSTLGHLLLIAAKIAKDQGFSDPETDGFRIVINHGKNGGEAVPHLHVHLLAGRKLEWPPG